MRFEVLPARYEDLGRREHLPLDRGERERFRKLAPRFSELCDALRGTVPYSIQHDDLHMGNVFDDGETLRVLDWGDSSVAHPFFSPVVTFQFLEEVSKLPPTDPWFTRLRAAYLEPWGPGYEDVLELALRVGAMAYAIAWGRQWEHLPEAERSEFTEYWGHNIRRAMAQLER
jgi:Ser/Thr protein kinase RdoA (MazF antagonist)